MVNFEGKVAVITGAAKGIGKSILQKFSSLGAKTVNLDFDEAAGMELAQILEKEGKEHLFIKTDVSSFLSLEAAHNMVAKKHGAIDILVINAGISQKKGIDEISAEEWDKVLGINLSGSFYTVKAFYEDFKGKTRDDAGKIVFITSGSAITGTGGGAHYASSKAGQHGLMCTVSKELGPLGVNVNAIAPRVIQTDILDILYPTQESRAELIKKIPIGRVGQAEDIANLAVFLASEESSYVHGQIILCDGGRTY